MSQFTITNSGQNFVFSGGIISDSIECNTSVIIPSDVPSSPSVGSIYFNSSDNLLYVYNGSVWTNTPGPTGSIGPNGSNGSIDPTGYTGPAGVGSVGPTGPAGEGSVGPTGPAGAGSSPGPAISYYASGQQTNISNQVIQFTPLKIVKWDKK